MSPTAEGNEGLADHLRRRGNYPEIWRDCAMKGAELISIRWPGLHLPPRTAVIMAKAMPWTTTSMSRSRTPPASTASTPFRPFPHHRFDGRTLGECGEEYYASNLPALQSLIRDARTTGHPHNHLFKLVHAATPHESTRAGRSRASRPVPYEFDNKWIAVPTRQRARWWSSSPAYHRGHRRVPDRGHPRRRRSRIAET